jgi:predicted nucleic-acid-binding Zn-ribbon protein
MKYEAPELKKEAFNCPHCQAYSHQVWYEGSKKDNLRSWVIPEFYIATCSRCDKNSFWFNDKLISPEKTGIPYSNKDLQEEIQIDYNEAASIINKSPRGAAALLRLAIQKLCKQLGESGENINSDIANLVQKGLPIQVQQALDTVRVIGNECVHPGEINLNDNKEIAIKLFELVNIIARIMITQPKEIEKLYKTLPKQKLDGIESRDSKIK